MSLHSVHSHFLHEPGFFHLHPWLPGKRREVWPCRALCLKMTEKKLSSCGYFAGLWHNFECSKLNPTHSSDHSIHHIFHWSPWLQASVPNKALLSYAWQHHYHTSSGLYRGQAISEASCLKWNPLNSVTRSASLPKFKTARAPSPHSIFKPSEWAII